MKVYILRADSNRYQTLVPVRADTWQEELARFDGTPFGTSWSPVDVQVSHEDEKNKDLLPSDFPSLIPYIPVFSRRAIEVLGDLLQGNGEILPLNCTEGVYFAFNVTRIVDALDTSRSQLKLFQSTGRIMRVIRYEFLTDKLSSFTIFKLPQFDKSEVFVTDGFVQRVQEHNLTGFVFNLVWI